MSRTIRVGPQGAEDSSTTGPATVSSDTGTSPTGSPARTLCSVTGRSSAAGPGIASSARSAGATTQARTSSQLIHVVFMLAAPHGATPGKGNETFGNVGTGFPTLLNHRP